MWSNIALGISIVTFAAVGVLAVTGSQARPTLPKLDEFRAWHKVNDKPYPMTPEAWVLCRMPTPRELRTGKYDAKAAGDMGPHADKWVTVWVNDAGKEAMLKGKGFPVGSAIVKEKTDGFGSHSTFATAMVKREKGFNPVCGDWEFATLSLPEAKVTLRGKLQPCMKCHQSRPKEDYTFRPYVGSSTKGKG